MPFLLTNNPPLDWTAMNAFSRLSTVITLYREVGFQLIPSDDVIKGWDMKKKRLLT